MMTRRHVPVVEPALELGAGQAVRFDNLPVVIGNSQLEDTLGQINGNGSSMHFGLLSLKTDPHPHEHRWRQFGAKKTGESIPSFKRARAAFWRTVPWNALFGLTRRLKFRLGNYFSKIYTNWLGLN